MAMTTGPWTAATSGTAIVTIVNISELPCKTVTARTEALNPKPLNPVFALTPLAGPPG